MVWKWGRGVIPWLPLIRFKILSLQDSSKKKSCNIDWTWLIGMLLCELNDTIHHCSLSSSIANWNHSLGSFEIKIPNHHRKSQEASYFQENVRLVYYFALVTSWSSMVYTWDEIPIFVSGLHHAKQNSMETNYYYFDPSLHPDCCLFWIKISWF